MKRLAASILLAGLVTAPAYAADRAASRAALAKGVERFNAHDLSGARVELLNAVAADPGYAAARMVQARILIDLGDGTGARATLDRAVAVGTAPETVRHLLAHALLIEGDPDAALKALEPGTPPRYAAYAARVRGLAFAAKSDVAETIAAFEDAARRDPKSAQLWADVGRFRIDTGDLAGAIDAGKRALQLDPRNIDALVLSGELVRGQYGLIAALPWFERALTVDPNNLPALVALAATQGDVGQNGAMLATTRRILSLDAKNPWAFYFQATMAARAGKTDLARGLMQRTGDRLGGEAGPQLLNAALDLEAGAYERAIATLKPLVAAQPPNIRLRRMLGAALWGAGDAQGTVETLGPLIERADADSYVLTLAGRAYEALDDRARAARYLDLAARPVAAEPPPYPGGTPAPGQSARDAKNVVPVIAGLLGSGNAAAALVEAQRVARENPGAPAAHVLVGDCLTALGRHRDAIAAYQRAANIAFAESTAMRLVRAHSRAGDGAGALRVLDLYLGQNPRSIPARVAAADYFMQTKQWDRAIATLEFVRARTGNRDAIVLGQLAKAHLEVGQLDRASAYAKAAHAISPNNPEIAKTYGWALHRRGGRRDAAIAMLAKAVRLAPADREAKVRLNTAQAVRTAAL